ncbi:MAG: CoA transferase [Acidimicrobiia bacterium]|nr:CoA transferase [Acidimicrobiia bacterium]
MTGQGPLAGLRVVDLTGDLGRFATKLLAEHGAEVCRPSGAGSRGASLAGPVGARGSLLDWWFDAAKVPIDLDLDTEAGLRRYRELTGAADLVVEAMPVGYLAERGIDHDDLVSGNAGLTQVSITPFGRTGPRADWQTSDLVAGALGGVLSITGTPAGPLNSWGWQNYNFASFAAAITALAGVRAARQTGQGQLVDLSVHEVVTGSIENLFMQYFYDDLLPLPKIAPRQGSLHWLGAYEVVPAKTGNIMITPTPQSEQLIDWMVAAGIEEAEPFVGLPVEEILEHLPELMAATKLFTATIDAAELWWQAQRKHIAFGEVQSIATVAANPQFEHRGLFTDSGTDSDGDGVRAPWRLVRYSHTPVGTPPGPPAEPQKPERVVERWAEADPPAMEPAANTAEAAAADPAAPPLDGVRVLDLSWVLAGPFATRLLGDLGADVVKLQTEERATLVNRPDFPYYPVWNRSKRSVTLDLKHPDALPMIRRLIEGADVLVENYSAGVLDRLGLGWDAVRTWNDRLVYVSMSGCGHDGPWADVISYAPTIHALCGLTHLTNPPGRGDVGCGFSLNDHAAGFAAAFAVLAALEARNRIGVGQHIDMAQLEVGTYLVGPALIDHFVNGADPQPVGNADPLVDMVPNEVYPCAGGGFVAVTANDDAMWCRLAAIVGLDPSATPTVGDRRAARATIDAAVGRWCTDRSAAEAMVELQRLGVAAGAVQNAEDLLERDEQHAARRFWLTAEHDQFGSRPHDRFPALWSRSRLDPYLRAPSYLGEANFDVWCEVAELGPEEVAEGIADGLFS